MVIVKVVMDSGKEYEIEFDGDIKEFVDSLKPPVGVGIYYITLAEGLLINTSHISSIEYQ